MPLTTLEPSPAHLKAMTSFLKLTQEPANFDAIYDLDEVLTQSSMSHFSIDYLKSQPGIAQIIQEQYLASVPNLEQLLMLPVDSLGYHFATHLKANGFDPEFYRLRVVDNDISYLALRRSQTHDIHHVVTGFGTSLADEIGLQAFQLAQVKSPLAIALMASSLVHTLPSMEQLNAIITRIHQGWQLGLQAKPFFAQKWEDHWEKPLAQWRAELDVTPISPLV